MQSHARAPTDKAARYMTQLAKHWSHKYETAFDATTARIVLPLGVCRMTADTDALEVTLEPTEGADLARFERVVAEHLNRFAFREPLTLDWSR